MTQRLSQALLITLMLALSASAEDVDFPGYTSWAKQPIGTTIKVRTTTAGPVSTVMTTVTSKLIQVGPDKLTLEVVKTSNATGETQTTYPEKEEIRRRFPLFPGMKKEDIGKAPKTALATGTETVEQANRKINTFWYEEKGSVEAGPTELKTWLSDEVPGRLVKQVTKVPIAKLTITKELVEYTVPDNTAAKADAEKK